MKKFVLSLILSLTLCAGLTLGFTLLNFSNTSAETQTSNRATQTSPLTPTAVGTENTYGVSNVTTTINTTGKTNPITFKGVFSKDKGTTTSTSLISFLEITIGSNLNENDYKSIAIKRSNSGTNASTYTETTDEFNTEITASKKTYYFTRETSFIVELYQADGTVVVSAQCSFSPVINETALQTLYSNISYFNGEYYCLGNGNSEITPKPITSKNEDNVGLVFDSALYSISINDVVVPESDQKVDKLNGNYQLIIPKNSYGKIKVTFTSKKAFITRSFVLNVINPVYTWNFYDSQGSDISNQNQFGKYYVFNEAVDLKVGISTTLIDVSKSAETITSGIKYFDGFKTYYSITPLDISEKIELNITETIRDSANTKTASTKQIVVDPTETYWNYSFGDANHSIYKISTSLKGAPKTTPPTTGSENIGSTQLVQSSPFAISDDALTFKIITKVPFSYNGESGESNGKYDIAIYQHSQGSNYGGAKNEPYNYINSAIYGKLTRQTNIYFLSESASIYNNNSNVSLFVKIGESSTSLSGNEKLISPFTKDDSNNSKKTIQIKNITSNPSTDESFASFYSFTFDATYYKQQSNIENKFFGNIISESDSAFSYTENGKTKTTNLTNAYVFSMFKNSSTASTNFLAKKEVGQISKMPTIYVDGDLKMPVYMNLVYNFNRDNYEKTTSGGNIFWDSNSFENFYELKKGDKIEFIEPGVYIVELYTFPSHEFAMNFVNRANTTSSDSSISESSIINNNYIRFEFEIAGPNISATSTNNHGETIPLSNRMLTQNQVRISVQFTKGAGQVLTAYKNNVEFNSFDESSSTDGVLTFYLDRANYAGSWTFTVFDASGNALKSLNFSIIDTAYLGFTINNREEYELLEVFDGEGNKLPTTHCYDLLDEGDYRINIANADKVPFLLTQDGRTRTTYAEKSATNSVIVSVQKPYFEINFTNNFEEDSKRTTEDISIGSVNGIEISKVTVFLNGKEIESYDPRVNDTGIGGLISSGHTYSNNGLYTIRITDKFNNSFEVQVEKYYKINYALIILIAIVIFALLFLIWFIYRSRRGLKVR